MTRNELKEIIQKVLVRVKDVKKGERDAPQPACLYGDSPPPGPTTLYGVGEEA